MSIYRSDGKCMMQREKLSTSHLNHNIYQFKKITTIDQKKKKTISDLKNFDTNDYMWNLQIKSKYIFSTKISTIGTFQNDKNKTKSHRNHS